MLYSLRTNPDRRHSHLLLKCLYVGALLKCFKQLKQLRAVGKHPDYMRNILIRRNEVYNICFIFLILCMGVAIPLITGAQLIDNYCEVQPLLFVPT